MKNFGGDVIMTRDDHPTGTDRIAEAVNGIDCDLIVNLQGDEPLLPTEVIDELIDEDWQHNVHADDMLYFFTDYQYLLTRIQFDPAKHNILELTKKPDSNVVPTDAFRFCGYDIMDSDDSISVLLNCGSFPNIITSNDTNLVGLIDKLDDANRIAENIRRVNPDAPHCQDCRVWGIARYAG